MAGQMQELVDRGQIVDLLAQYATALDTRDWDALGEVLTPDATCDYGSLGSPRGVEQITSLVRSTLSGLDATQHLIGNVTVRVEGDQATAECYLIAQHIRTGAPGGDHYLIGGRYSDQLVRTAEGWRISHRTLHRMWTTGNRSVIQRP